MLTADQTRMRESRTEIVSVLRDLGAQFKGESNHCRCPFHDDKEPSAGVFRTEDGSWHFRCHGCAVKGDVFDFIARRDGRTVAEALREHHGDAPSSQRTTEPPPRMFASIAEMEATMQNREATYRYTNPDTSTPDLVVFRVTTEQGGKKFLQASHTHGGFALKAPLGPLPLYNRSRVRAAADVVFVEGEKCVHALHEIGIVATTTPGGAGNSAKCDLSPLAGKTIYLFPDNDPPDAHGRCKGSEHMREIASHLETLEPACSLYWIDPTTLDLPPKGDAVELLNQNGGTIADKRTKMLLVMDEAEPLGAAKGLHARLQDIIAGRWRTIPLPWAQLTQLSKALLPGTITVIPGDPGGGKSFLLLEALWWWHMQGICACVFELEEDRTYHLQRALAQIDNNSALADDEWIRTYPAEAMEAYDRNRALLDSFGRVVFEAPEDIITLDALAGWVERQAGAGFEVICIDPITAAATGDKPWIDDQNFIFKVKSVLRRYGARLVLVTHPRKNRGKARMVRR